MRNIRRTVRRTCMLILGLKELILPEICGRLLAALTGFHCAFIRAKRHIVSYAGVLRRLRDIRVSLVAALESETTDCLNTD